MASQHRKARGYRTQKLVAEYLALRHFPYAESTGASRQGSDVTGTPGLAVEVKARADFSPLAWLKQAHAGAHQGDTAICVVRPNGMGEDASQYLTMLTLKDFMDLWEKAHAES